MTDERDHRDHLEASEPGHEPLTISVRAVAIGAVALVLLIAVTIVAMAAFTRLLTPRETGVAAGPFQESPREVPQSTVGLNPNQSQDRLQFEARQHALLREYAWLDDGEQVARIPIEKAMQLIQQQGLDIVSQMQVAPAEDQNEPLDGEGGEQ